MCWKRRGEKEKKDSNWPNEEANYTLASYYMRLKVQGENFGTDSQSQRQFPFFTHGVPTEKEKKRDRNTSLVGANVQDPSFWYPIRVNTVVKGKKRKKEQKKKIVLAGNGSNCRGIPVLVDICPLEFIEYKMEKKRKKLTRILVEHEELSNQVSPLKDGVEKKRGEGPSPPLTIRTRIA